MPPVKVTPYTLKAPKLTNSLTVAVISDLHNEPYEHLLPLIKDADLLLVPGDISDRYRNRYDQGIAFLHDAAQLLPTFFSLGNHEVSQTGYSNLRRALNSTGAEILVNRHVRFGELVIGGWYDPQWVREPARLGRFEREEGYKLLLCHKPHEYMRKLRGLDVDLVVSGHAHGGQVCLFGRALYAPGQGIFPRWTRGIVDDRMIVSAGVGNPVHMPRWGNPREVLMIHLQGGNKP